MPDLNLIERVIALEAVELFQSLTPEQLSRIAAIAKEVTFPPGKVILEPGQPMEELYVILDGAVEISRNTELIHTAGQNQVLGAWALFDSEPMPVSAKAKDDVRLLKIGRDDFYDLLGDNMQITASIFAVIVKRFRKLVEG